MDIFDDILAALESREQIVVATVIGSRGSTPAPVLSRMLIGPGGDRIAGTIGGGCVEAEVIEAARHVHGVATPAVMTFALDEDHPESGMLCGGTLEVFVETLTKGDRPLLESLAQVRQSGEDSLRVSVIARDGALLDRLLLPCGAGGCGAVVESFPSRRPEITLAIERLVRQGGALRVPLDDGEVILELIAGTPSLFVFGGGHIARFLTPLAVTAGFRVTVVDDREEFASAGRFPEASRTIVADFRASFSLLPIRENSSIVIVTRGHRSDEEVLEAAVGTSAGYIGMIGSRTKVAQTFDHLQARGILPEALRRVRAPIGIDIGAVTPGEIAVSIVAELIHARRVPGRALSFKASAMWQGGAPG